MNAGNFPEALLRAVRLEAQYRLHLKNGRVFPKPEGDFLPIPFLGEIFQVNQIFQLWEGTIFFRSFLERVES